MGKVGLKRSDFTAKMHQIDFCWDSDAGPAGVAYSTTRHHLAVFKGPTSLRRGRSGKEGEKMEKGREKRDGRDGKGEREAEFPTSSMLL